MAGEVKVSEDEGEISVGGAEELKIKEKEAELKPVEKVEPDEDNEKKKLTEEEQQSFKNKIKEIKAQGGTLDELIKILKKGIDEKKALPFAIKNTKKL